MRPLLVAALVLLAGCGDGARGLVVTSDGDVAGNTAERFRTHAEATIADSLDRQFAPHWRVRVALDHPPEDYLQGDRDVREGWMWQRLAASVELIGDGQAALPEGEDAVRAAVERYLRPKVERPRELTVMVRSGADPARFAVLTAPAQLTPASAAPSQPAGDAGLRYIVQRGDTLALISSAFYGTPQHWRLIADANPGVDPGALAPGTALVIPRLPKP